MERQSDLFDSILFSDDRLEVSALVVLLYDTKLFRARLSAKGFEEGCAHGSKQGFDDAYAAGYTRGKDIGKEVAWGHYLKQFFFFVCIYA